jgi:hypothetical protein
MTKTTVRVTFDGRVFVPEKAVNLPVGSVLEIAIDPPAERSADALEEQFQRLAAEWEKAVAHHSSSRIRYEHPAYQAIIHLGPPVVPLLLRDLESTGRHWFAALKAITGADPVPAGAAGKIAEMTAAWLRWGAEHRYQRDSGNLSSAPFTGLVPRSG